MKYKKYQVAYGRVVHHSLFSKLNEGMRFSISCNGPHVCDYISRSVYKQNIAWFNEIFRQLQYGEGENFEKPVIVPAIETKKEEIGGEIPPPIIIPNDLFSPAFRSCEYDDKNESKDNDSFIVSNLEDFGACADSTTDEEKKISERMKYCPYHPEWESSKFNAEYRAGRCRHRPPQ